MAAAFLSKLKLNKANYELFPLVFFISGTCVMAGTFSLYALLTKPDVVLFKKSNPRPWEIVDPKKNQKLIGFFQTPKPIPALEQLKKEMGER